MAVRVGINGFGRIGRLVLRAALERKGSPVEVVAINDLGSAEANAHLFKHDTVHGQYPATVKATNAGIAIDGVNIEVHAERDPTKLPWGKLGIDVVAECTGIFTKRSDAEKHIAAGAKRVLISAPATDEDITVCFGVNEDKLAASHKVISNASCTTNCLAPVAYVLDQAVGIERGYMTTVHSYTGDQAIVDTLHRDLRRARAAALNMIPTSTGAAKAVGLVLPHLKGKLDGTAIRVPTANVSMIDFKFVAKKKTSAEELNDAARKAAGTARLKGILAVNDDPLVSSDFNHNPASATFDATQTQVIEGSLCRVLAWYDNEWGFSNRMVDTLGAVGRLG
jgi:glyceraldehyde 3-phosphate dehydrogenase